MQTYTIHDRSEETDCSYCGMPLYVGDKAVDADIDVFCSEICAIISASRTATLTSEQEYDRTRAQRWDNQNQSRYFGGVGDTY